MNPNINSVLVAGDIVIDRHIYEGDRAALQDHSLRGTSLVEELGGAAITQRLIEAVFAADFEDRHAMWKEAVRKASEEGNPAPQEPEVRVCRLGCKLADRIESQCPGRLIGYASWAPFPGRTSEDSFWRVSKPFGYGGGTDSYVENPANPPSKDPVVLQVANNVTSEFGILVLDDAGDDFRRQEHESLWHLPMSQGHAESLPRWIVLKLAGPIGRGDLWDRLMQREPEKRLVVLISARLLRTGDVRLSRGLSWERTAEHLLKALHQDPAIRDLRKARHLIVHFEADGAVWIDFTNAAEPSVRMVFDPEHAEGEWARRIKGEAFGYASCLTAAIVQTLASSGEKDNDPDFLPPIERGLSAMRTLREQGHGMANAPGDGFPAARLARDTLHPNNRFARAVVPWKESTTGSSALPWSILAALQNPLLPSRPLYGFARQLAVQGEAVLSHVPHLRICELITADRSEIESLRSLRRILEGYRDTASGKKPLSIGVFGAPGAGKSFGVEQLAVGIFGEPGKKSYDGWMEFNLSQFSDSGDLIGAFHQVRDRVLKGLIPVVFWDEFDSRQYHWLQYLLAPMQDGRFQQGQITHTLGKCVFIFAGGTAESFEEFGPKPDDDDETKRRFKLAKGPDFKSRLDGYLNVLGPNQRRLPAQRGETRPKDEADIFFPVRRALMIRNILRRNRHQELDIDPGLLTALLEIEDYKHGARSLSKVLEPFGAALWETGARLRRSQLPAPNQLALHVITQEFHDLCARDLAFQADEITDKLARAIHETWREIAHREKRKPRYDVDYDELPPDMKRSNVAAARRIPDILALVGLQPVSSAEKEPKTEHPIREHLERHIEALAEEEHNGWMAHLHAEGWRFADTRDDDKRLHDCLRPFHELRELDKDKDRNSVRHYPDFAQMAGFKIVFI